MDQEWAAHPHQPPLLPPTDLSQGVPNLVADPEAFQLELGSHGLLCESHLRCTPELQPKPLGLALADTSSFPC